MIIPVEALKAWTEAQCSIAYKVPIHSVRKQKKKAKVQLESPLSFEGMQEIFVLHDSVPAKDVAKLYLCDHQDVIKARYRLRNKRAYTTPKASEVESWLATGLDERTVATTLGCSIRYVRKIVKTSTTLVPRAHSSLTTEQQIDIIASLKDKAATQKELASIYDVSQSTVCKLNPSKLKRAKYTHLTAEQWKQLLLELKTEKGITITTLGKRYKISRSAIYQRLKELDNA